MDDKGQVLCVKFKGDVKQMIEETRFYLTKKIIESEDRKAKMPTFKDAAYYLIRIGYKVLFGGGRGKDEVSGSNSR